ncbi:MAG TPA: AMIN domain-containing protein [Acidobacteriota bacterium]
MKLVKRHFRGLCFCLALSVVLVGAVQAQEPPQTTTPQPAPVSVLKEVSFQKVEIAEQLQVIIKIEGPFLIETFELTAPKRLVIDFSSVTRIDAQPIIQVNDMGVLNIRTGQFQSSVARVVFDMDVRTPSHSITTMPDGVKVTFWQEPLPQPEVTEKPEVKPGEKPGQIVPAIKRPSFIVRGGPGLTFFLKPSFTAQTECQLYGETATITETFDQQLRPVFDLCLGKTFGPKWTIGLGASLQLLGASPTLAASLPHPFLYDQYREVTFEAEALSSKMKVVSATGEEPREVSSLSSSMWTVYAFGLYSLVQTEKIEFSMGLALGFSFGTLFSLEDMQISETPPYGSQNVSIDSVTFLENKFFKIDPGLLISGTYSLNPNLSLALSLRLHYADVMLEELARRASLFRLNFLVGLQYGF